MHILHSSDFNRHKITAVLDKTAAIRHAVRDGWLRGRLRRFKNKLMASLFFEPSTRTRLSFETAMKRLGGDFISVADGNTSSTRKGESLEDTLKNVSQYVDVIVVRHPQPGALTWGGMSDVPVINAGDGDNEHPTQALLDLFTIRQYHGTIDGLKIMFSGDIKHSRTTKSLLRMLVRFDVQVYLHYPAGLGPDIVDCRLHATGIASRDTFLPTMDVLYLIRPQQERWSEEVKGEQHGQHVNEWVLDEKSMSLLNERACILHPLPRNEELPRRFDKDPRCLIWDQVRNGVFVRMALLRMVLED